MRFTATFPRWLLLTSLPTLLLLSACGGSSAATTATPGPGTATSAATATNGTSPTVTASTSLCDLMSLAAMSAVLGGTVGNIVRAKTTAADGSTAVNCTYLPSGGAHVDAEISYLFTSNGATAYAKDKADDASRGEKETDLSGLGDAAFWAISPAHANTLQLTAQKGNVLLVMTLGGAGVDGSTMLSGATNLARQALPSI